MAAFNRPTEATYTVHENVTVDTSDNEDHTFCGIMFPIKCKDLLPLDHIVIKSVAVRGALGPLTVWVSNEDGGNGRNQVQLDPRQWTKLYEKTHKYSKHSYKELFLDQPIRMSPGQVKCIYIHSTLPNDEAIVYDNSYYGMSSKRYDDEKLTILTGRAHVSPEVFGQNPIWGWGNAWRDRREFVGRLEYGTVYKLWNPQVQPKFGGKFQDCARVLSLCQRRWESPFSMLPDECIYYILNMCRWDWFEDDGDTMKQRRKREKQRVRELQQQEQQQQQSGQSEEGAEAEAVTRNVEAEAQATTGCNRGSMDTDDDGDDDGDDEEYVEDDDAEEEEEDEEGDVNSEAWSDDEDQIHDGAIQSFTFHNVDSDDEDENGDDSDDEMETARNAWVRRNFARIQVLRALAAMEDGEYVEY
mmetsp:Transcript_43843/g.105785  ORF Transcript_43843/g.105785 Transcript_43843/m.105785 type:complete len:413 (+) Transcript_43843:62-1300(+)|eukprot:CAMPEP_0113654062 /NCGR_PEP_ID=MMETSP0017_2-20120614/28950_1 /TAXON_ID=2856 /ORGANISM="Cylindrotheca closterium" /LENGTH=412 /DNA_ID=CAMNT_0000567173 /DNA_START=62 /DNA_END=1300 /DNA_ORIENTATION=+ /assembly_acc=CAM_ASM_000147